jgi:hypothetical protein
MIKVSIDRQVMKSVMSGVADQIKIKVDLNRVKKLCKKLYGIETIEGVEHKDADIVVIENQVGCKLDLEVRFSMSILVSTRENSDSSLPVNNNIPKELDDIPKELDLSEELDDIPEEELDLSGFEDIREEKLDDMGRLKEKPLMTRTTRKRKKIA